MPGAKVVILQASSQEPQSLLSLKDLQAAGLVMSCKFCSLSGLRVQATHDQVPPDVLEPVLRQLVDQFIHDRARPAVMTVGIKTVRELCARSPLIMTPELLQVQQQRHPWFAVHLTSPWGTYLSWLAQQALYLDPF